VRRRGPSASGLAFKALEIEELADVYFFRPLGMILARAARALRLSPTQVTLVGAAVGVAGGALLYQPRFWLLAFALLILHGILDSSDGQLARMTGQVSELGRLLDGAGGYITHFAIYAALIAGVLAKGGSQAIVWLAAAAALANVVHAQMYDYHRTAYARIVIKGQAVSGGSILAPPGRFAAAIIRGYEAIQARLAGAHTQVERVIAARSLNGLVVTDEDRARYRSCFYWPVRGWNLFGDNTRFYAIGALAWLQRPEWFFTFLLLPMNAALALVWLWQLRADRRFLRRGVID
jgi:phosphatidylglycerophosphate synthase